MFRIYQLMIALLRMLRRLIEQIEKHDRDLGGQLRRAAASVALNLGEGSGSWGGNRMLRFRAALGSAREVEACLDVAEALGYVESVDPCVREQLNAVIGGLVHLVR
jgi:four helix bundle protein